MNSSLLSWLLIFSFMTATVSLAEDKIIGGETDAKPEATKGAKKEESEPKTIAEVAAKSQKFDGLFTLYQDSKTGALYFAIRKDQIDREYVYFTFTENGIASLGHFRGNFRDNRVLSLRRHYDRLELVSENTAYYFNDTNALKRSRHANISHAVLISEKILNIDSAEQEFLIKADSIFLTEALHQVKPTPKPDEEPNTKFSLGELSKDKTKYVRVKNYPSNTDVMVEYVYENTAPVQVKANDVTDERNISITMQHSLIEMPKGDYQPRRDDARVGYFTVRVTDLTSTSSAPYRDLIDRWHLVKKNPNAAISEPVEPIVWWIENTTPHEFRDTITKAALAWNDAFEAAGFRNAVVVKVQPDNANWDAGDIRYNVLRWTSSPNPPFGGYGPHFVNPRTGQVIGADIMLEWVFVTNRLRLEKIFETAALGLPVESESSEPLTCSLGHQLQESVLFGAHVLAAAGAPQVEVTDLIHSALHYLILHEIGHTLGLSHNFKASLLHSPDEVHNKAVTATTGVTGSVMDYPAINIAPPGTTQGHYFTMRPGAYDIWAVQYAYSEGLENPEAEERRLDTILARSTESALAFGNDADDMRRPGKGIDPHAMIYDMSSDPIRLATERFEIIREVLPRIRDKFSKPGKSYHELRNAYLVLTGQYAWAARIVSRYIGGVHVDRGVVGQVGTTRPFTPVSAKNQRHALATLRKYVFSPTAFDVPQEIYSHLQMQRRSFDFFERSEDPKIHERVLNIHKDLLDQLLHHVVLKRVTDSHLYGNSYLVTDLFKDLTAAIFDDDLETAVNTFRQNLQTEYVKRLIDMIKPGSENPYDHVSQAMAHSTLAFIRVKVTGDSTDPLTEAHRYYLGFLIDKALKRE